MRFFWGRLLSFAEVLLGIKSWRAKTSAAAEIIDGVGRLHLNYAIKKRAHTLLLAQGD
jgi:hypothetical protein